MGKIYDDVMYVEVGWICSECGWKCTWTYLDCVDSGTPVCEQCSCVMDLDLKEDE